MKKRQISTRGEKHREIMQWNQGHWSQWWVGEHKVFPRSWHLKNKKESSRERRGSRASLQRESSSYKGFTMAESFKKSVKRSAIGGMGMSGHPEWWQMGRGHWQRAFFITPKVGFYFETYGESLKDLNLTGSNLKFYEVYLSNLVENGSEGAPMKTKNTQNIFQTCSIPNHLSGRGPVLAAALSFAVLLGRLLPPRVLTALE